MTRKLRVGILGATGVVGQRFIQLLDNHPQFTVTALAASDRSQGRSFGQACTWRLQGAMPRWVTGMTVAAPTPPLDCDLVFSSLPTDVAGETETAFAHTGHVVVSNSSPHRMHPDVPLVIPEVNAEHLCLVEGRRGGFIVTNPNCTAIGVALALAPLHARFRVASVTVATMQALSGAGYPGVPALDMTDNVIPYIAGEEEKVEREVGKLLGGVGPEGVEPAHFPVSAQCHRVAVQDGHLAAMWVRLEADPDLDEVRRTLADFRGPPQHLGLHSAPERPLLVRAEPDRPQPRLDRDAGRGMSVTVGRMKRDAAGWYRMLVLSHNTIRGAAGAAVLNAELLVAHGLIRQGS